jgi:antitoxin (DNA-binding transcriptional repressor) of toxin-antitoxin stability system
MQTVSIDEAKTKFTALLKRVSEGERMVIAQKVGPSPFFRPLLAPNQPCQ